ncbi:hypothetical protein DLAC_11828 [Tieghemostelium lacteum]|uniref:PNT domain-containing protein n=1 Tax=Tieghemostelium lacteum TaxID=361077 RepID=A0A151Z3W0_TIELA|nr:hypothetical protein DLAC_11828 [Tieghemostelium lacteum]|eukprot:KYQ88652.1 hypothetical protein DLAC_11828 [Tieghemostelium lacteum]
MNTYKTTTTTTSSSNTSNPRTHIEIDPRDWTIDNTKDWLDDFKSNFDEDINFETALNVKGSLLVKYSRETFNNLSRQYGSPLYDDLQSIIKKHSQPNPISIDSLSKISTEELEKELLSRKRKFSVLEEDEISNVQNAGEENLLSGTHFLSSKFSSMHIQTSVQQ